MATIKDIANNLGLSASTVSRALNGYSSISSTTKEKVMAEAKRLNFTMNSLAKSLISNKSYTIALLMDIENEQAFQNSYFYGEMHGIENYVYQQGYSLLVANVKTAPKGQNMIDFLIKSKRTDGIILPSNILDAKLTDKLGKENVPFVSIGQPDSINSSVSWADIDNLRGTESAVQHFLKTGKSHIAFLGLNRKNLFSIRRYEGYKTALTSNGIKVNDDYVIACGKTKEDGYEETKLLLKAHPEIDGVLCADELISIGVLKALNEADKKVPDDVSIISFDNSEIAQLSYPSITTIDVDVFELGYQSARLLFDLMKHPHAKSQGILIGTGIEFRETTK